MNASALPTILVVEDDPEALDVLRRRLEHAGYRVLGAADGDSALRAIGEHQDSIDLVITDVDLPGRSGPDLVRAARQRFPALRVLYLSALDPAMVGTYGLAVGRAPFLAKPYDAPELLKRVVELLESPDGFSAG